MTARPLNFASAQERQDWLIQNADYFTTARFINRKLERQEHKTLDGARQVCPQAAGSRPHQARSHYAVCDKSDMFVEMVKP